MNIIKILDPRIPTEGDVEAFREYLGLPEQNEEWWSEMDKNKDYIAGFDGEK